MKSPFVSVIIPNYCHARYLDQRMQSVLNQSYQNFEVIILDDASPDDGASRRIIESYREDPHVSHVVYNEVNSGSTFKQWLRGMELARGGLIWIAESDDTCDLNLLATLVNEYTQYPKTVIAYSTSCDMDPDGNIYNIPRSRKNRHLSGTDYIRKYLSYGNSIYNASSCVFKKDVAMGIDQAYIKYKGAGDWFFWILMAEKGEVSVVNKRLNHYRKHNNNTTAKCYADGSNFKENKAIYDILKRKGYYNFATDCHAKWFNYDLIRHTDFVNEEVQTEVLGIWHLETHEVFLGRLYDLYRIYGRRLQYVIECVLSLIGK